MQPTPSNHVSMLPTALPPFHLWGRSWQEKFPVIIVGTVILVVVAILLLSHSIKTSLAPKASNPLTDAQKVQILKDLSGNSSAPQLPDKEKLQILKKLSSPQQNNPQPSDADKIKILQQVGAK